MKTFLYSSSLIALFAAAPVWAQKTAPEETDTAGGDPMIVELDSWAYDPLYESAWSIERLMDGAEVRGVDGEQIGDVENILIGSDGQVLALIAEVGGFWDIGDTHVAVPWDEVEMAAEADALIVPVDEDNVGDYSVFQDEILRYHEAESELTEVDDDLAVGSRVTKATDLIGDYAFLTGGERYGYVNDLLVENGTIAAVVVDASEYGTPGYYAYPYAGYDAAAGWRYTLPYGADDITVIDTYDYAEMERAGEMETGETETETN